MKRKLRLIRKFKSNKKRIAALLMISVLSATLFPFSMSSLAMHSTDRFNEQIVRADIKNQGEFNFREVAGGVEIVGYTGESTLFAPPEMIDNKKVISIATENYKAKIPLTGVENIKEIDLSNCTDCKKIGSFAFYYCEQLESVNAPTCEEIGEGAFYCCRNLKTIIAPECKCVKDSAFWQCGKLKTVMLEKCKELGKWVFSVCNNLETINLPECELIDQKAFYNCRSLKSVMAPMCKLIGKLAFDCCISLDTLDLSSCDVLYKGIFNLCPKITNVSLNKDTLVEKNTFLGCPNINVKNPSAEMIRNKKFEYKEDLAKIFLGILCDAVKNEYEIMRDAYDDFIGLDSDIKYKEFIEANTFGPYINIAKIKQSNFYHKNEQLQLAISDYEEYMSQEIFIDKIFIEELEDKREVKREGLSTFKSLFENVIDNEIKVSDSSLINLIYGFYNVDCDDSEKELYGISEFQLELKKEFEVIKGLFENKMVFFDSVNKKILINRNEFMSFCNSIEQNQQTAESFEKFIDCIVQYQYENSFTSLEQVQALLKKQKLAYEELLRSNQELALKPILSKINNECETKINPDVENTIEREIIEKNKVQNIEEQALKASENKKTFLKLLNLCFTSVNEQVRDDRFEIQENGERYNTIEAGIEDCINKYIENYYGKIVQAFKNVFENSETIECEADIINQELENQLNGWNPIIPLEVILISATDTYRNYPAVCNYSHHYDCKVTRDEYNNLCEQYKDNGEQLKVKYKEIAKDIIGAYNCIGNTFYAVNELEYAPKTNYIFSRLSDALSQENLDLDLVSPMIGPMVQAFHHCKDGQIAGVNNIYEGLLSNDPAIIKCSSSESLLKYLYKIAISNISEDYFKFCDQYGIYLAESVGGYTRLLNTLDGAYGLPKITDSLQMHSVSQYGMYLKYFITCSSKIKKGINREMFEKLDKISVSDNYYFDVAKEVFSPGQIIKYIMRNKHHNLLGELYFGKLFEELTPDNKAEIIKIMLIQYEIIEFIKK